MKSICIQYHWMWCYHHIKWYCIQITTLRVMSTPLQIWWSRSSLDIICSTTQYYIVKMAALWSYIRVIHFEMYNVIRCQTHHSIRVVHTQLDASLSSLVPHNRIQWMTELALQKYQGLAVLSIWFTFNSVMLLFSSTFFCFTWFKRPRSLENLPSISNKFATSGEGMSSVAEAEWKTQKREMFGIFLFCSHKISTKRKANIASYSSCLQMWKIRSEFLPAKHAPFML